MWYLVKCTDCALWYYFICDRVQNRCKLIAIDLTEAAEKALIDSFNQGKPLPCYDQTSYAEWGRAWDMWSEWAYETIWIAEREYSEKEWEAV